MSDEILSFDVRFERDGDRHRAIVDLPDGVAGDFPALRVAGLGAQGIAAAGGQTRAALIDAIATVDRDFGAQGERGDPSAEELGSVLFAAVFAGSVLDRYTARVAEARAKGARLRLRLCFDGAPELLALPWEYLHDDRVLHGFPALDPLTPLVRVLGAGVLPAPPLLAPPPLRVLVMISAPADAPRLNVLAELDRIQQALDRQGLRRRGLVALDVLEEATLPALGATLRQRYHVLHFVGHGGFADGAGFVVLERPEADPALGQRMVSHRVAGDKLGAVLSDCGFRLVVLNSCEGARAAVGGAAADVFSGCAQALVRARVPAVIANQLEISDDAAVTFAGELYAALAGGLTVDAAVCEARRSVFASRDDFEWGVPTLYLGDPDGRLIEAPGEDHPAEDAPVAVRARLAGDGARVVGWSRDGRRALSSTSTCKVWDAATGRLYRTLPSRGYVGALSPDGRLVLTGGSDAPAALFDVETGREVPLEHPPVWIQAAAFSERYALAGAGSAVCLWDRERAWRISRVEGEGGNVVAAAFSADGARYAIGRSDGALEICHVDGSRPPIVVREPAAITAVTFSPKGDVIAVACDEPARTVRYRSAESGEAIGRAFALGEVPRSLSFSPDGARLVIGGDGPIRVWTGDGAPVPFAGSDKAYAVAFSPDGARVLAGDWEKVELWDAHAGARIMRLGALTRPVQWIARSSDGKHLFVKANDGVRAHDALTGKVVSTSPGGAATVLIGERLIAVDYEGRFYALEPGSAAPLVEWAPPVERIWQIAASADGARVASGSESGAIAIRDAAGRVLRSLHLPPLDGQPAGVTALALDATGARLAAGGDRGVLLAWDLATGDMRTLAGHTDRVTAVAFGPDGAIVSASADKTVRAWNADGSLRLTLWGHRGIVEALSLSPDGRTALSGGDDLTVRMWDLAAGREVLALRGHEAPVTAVGFTAHRSAVSGSRDGTVRFWDLAAQAELLSLVMLDDGDWLAITPDGYFDGSAWVADLVDARASGQVVPVMEYRPSLRNPDVIRRVLLGVSGATPDP